MLAFSYEMAQMFVDETKTKALDNVLSVNKMSPFIEPFSGRLRFANIEKGDAKEGKAYACHTINYFINCFRSTEVCEHREG